MGSLSLAKSVLTMHPGVYFNKKYEGQNSIAAIVGRFEFLTYCVTNQEIQTAPRLSLPVVCSYRRRTLLAEEASGYLLSLRKRTIEAFGIPLGLATR